MSQPRPPQARKALEVEVIFEPNRISVQCLIAAYEQILAPVRHDLPAQQESANLPEVELQTTIERVRRSGGQSR
jgi:hypothetical protein